MHRYDLVHQKGGGNYTVHDLVADIFGLEITDVQADVLLGLFGSSVCGTGQHTVVNFADTICNHFVGRGFPWLKEPVDEEHRFWSEIKACRSRLLDFIDKVPCPEY